MALPKSQKKFSVKLPVCPYCGAVAKHQGWQCPQNPKNRCKYCGKPGHSSLMCQSKPRRAMKKESEKTESKRTATSRQWFKENPPDHKGTWECYLQISPQCPVRITRSTITLEHVKPKNRYKELRYITLVIKPACEFCNKLKGPWTLEELAETYPRVAEMLLQSAWVAWEAEIAQFVRPELH